MTEMGDEPKDPQVEETRPDVPIPRAPGPVTISLAPGHSADQLSSTAPMAIVPMMPPSAPPSISAMAMASMADCGAMALFGYLARTGAITGREAVAAALLVVVGKLRPAKVGDGGAPSGLATILGPIAGFFTKIKG